MKVSNTNITVEMSTKEFLEIVSSKLGTDVSDMTIDYIEGSCDETITIELSREN